MALLLAPEGFAHGALHDRLQELAAALEQRPRDAAIHFALAVTFCAHGEWTFATTYAESADQLAPGRFAADLVRGEALLGAGRVVAARAALDRYAARQPGDARGRLLRARAIEAQQDIAGALEEFRAAVNAPDRRDVDQARAAAAAFAGAGRTTEAIAILSGAIAEYGGDPGLWEESLRLEIAAEAWPAALAHVDALQQCAPRPEPWLARRAEILMCAGRRDEAREGWAALVSHMERLPNLERGAPALRELLATARTQLDDLGASAGEPSRSALGPATAVAPAANASDQTTTTTLTVALSSVDRASEVTFFGRKTGPATPGPDFAIGTLPDTQYYSENLNGRSANFYAQTRWYAQNRDGVNTAFVSHLGDIVNSGDLKGGVSNLPEWLVADGALKNLENPVLTLRPHGIPWGAAPGNHDETPNGSATGTTTYFNEYFGTSRFAGRRYYGGHYGSNNNNNSYYFFSASGLDFVVIHLQYDARALTLYQPVLDWADAVLKANRHRRAIVVSHWIVNTGNPATFSPQAQLVYDRLKQNPNFFLMLGGHVSGEGRRSDTYNGRVVYSMLQDYQSRANGGDGWLRYYVFSPARNTITAKTYSPVLNRGESDADSEFTLAYDMQSPIAEWVPLGSVAVTAGATSASLAWTGLESGADYEWYAIVRDDTTTSTVPARRFVTASAAPNVELVSPSAAAVFNHPAAIRIAAQPAASAGTVARVEFYEAGTKLGEVTTPPYEITWTAPRTGSYQLCAVTVDSSGAEALSRIVPISVVNPNNQRPTVAWVAPATDLRLLTPAAITLAAAANDTDGTVAKVEFFADATKVGERTAPPYSLVWSSVPAGTYVLTAQATDNDGGVTVSPGITALVADPIVTALVPRNAIWKYLDDGSDQGTAWRGPAFDDGTWAAGPAELGYGDGDEATVIGLGRNPASKAITSYFRHTFTVADPAAMGQLALSLVRDDGAIVYLNGTEIGRSNLTAGTNYLFSTPAPTLVEGADERTFFALTFSTDPVPLLVRGRNTLAVEVHQQSGTSSDVSFNLELLDRRFPVRTPPTVALTAPPNGAMFVAPARPTLSASAADADGTVTKVEFLVDGASVGTAARAPYSTVCDSLAVGWHSVVAVATDNDGNFIASAPVALVVREADPGRFVNFAVRSNVAAGAGTLILGFVTGGQGTTGTKPLLLRAIGPGLAPFGVADYVADPNATLYTGSTLVTTNDNWAGSEAIRAMAAQVGAFPLTDPASRDAALITSRGAGTHSLQVAGTTGVALAEIYDATPGSAFGATTPRLINASIRTLVGPGNDILFAGLVIGGSTERTVLIRGVGPGLTNFGVSSVLADPRLQLFRAGHPAPIAANDDWGGGAMLLSTFARAGAFALGPTSRDAALVVRLAPGAYTAQLSAPAGASGVVLLDLYEVP